MIPSLPLRLRNRLAETIIAAPHDALAREEIETLASGNAEGWLDDGDAAWAVRLRERAQAALGALQSLPVVADSGTTGALAFAAALFDAGLYFEVHEVLEPHWMDARDAIERDVLQGLIQVAVGYQHFADGNVKGARSLLEQGGGRLHGRHVFGVDFEPLAREAVTAAGALPTPPTARRFPRVAARVTRS